MNHKLFNIINNNRVLRGTARRVAPVLNTTQMHAPEIALVSGLATGFVASVIFARAYKRQETVVEEVKHEIELIHEEIEFNKTNAIEENQFTIEDKANLLMPLYGAYIGITIRNYAPAVITGVVAVGLVLKSHGLMRGRTQGLIAALALADQGFREYRSRVSDLLGAEAEEGLYFGATERKIKTLTVDEDGKKHKAESTEWVFGENITAATYGRVFDPSHPEWQNNRDWNLFMLRAREKMANDYLNIHGSITLNKVYNILGYPETSYGAVVGWSLAGPGDDFVDFGLDRRANQIISMNVFNLDFNVNGTMFQYIGTKD